LDPSEQPCLFVPFKRHVGVVQSFEECAAPRTSIQMAADLRLIRLGQYLSARGSQEIERRIVRVPVAQRLQLVAKRLKRSLFVRVPSISRRFHDFTCPSM
jgi:hypothetical protein